MASIEKLTKLVQEHLESDENVIAVVQGAYEIKMMGRNSLRKGILIATNKRIVFYAKKLTGFDLEVIPYDKVSSYETGKAILGYYISLFTSGNDCKMKYIKSKDDFDTFVNHVKENIGKVKLADDQPANKPDIPDQIKKLSELKDDGILTADEFESKKQELLAKM